MRQPPAWGHAGGVEIWPETPEWGVARFYSIAHTKDNRKFFGKHHAASDGTTGAVRIVVLTGVNRKACPRRRHLCDIWTGRDSNRLGLAASSLAVVMTPGVVGRQSLDTSSEEGCQGD